MSYSVQQTVYALCFCLGSLLFGWLADVFAIEIVYALAGALSLLMWQPARQVLAQFLSGATTRVVINDSQKDKGQCTFVLFLIQF